MADYNEFFEVIADTFNNFGEFINEAIEPNSIFLGQAIAIVLMFLIILVVIIIGIKRGFKFGKRF